MSTPGHFSPQVVRGEEPRRADNVLCDEISVLEHDGERGTLRITVLSSLPPAKVSDSLAKTIARIVKTQCYGDEA